MALIVSAGPVPLRTDADGVARVGRARVPLATVVAVFDLGASPEEIVRQFLALDLADVCTVVGDHLRPRAEVTEFLRERREGAEAVRWATKSRYAAVGIRERLLRRRARAE